MANLVIIATQGSRIFADDGSWTPAGAENASISDWSIGDQFLLAAIVWGGGGCNKVTDAAVLRLDFSKDGGAWTPVGASSEISFATSTSITDNANITTNRITGDVPSAACSGSATLDGVQEEGSGTFTSFSIGTAEAWTEVWIALDTTNATAGSNYEFSLYNTTDGVRLTYGDGGLTADEPLLTDITMAAAAIVEASAADGINTADADSTILTAQATAPDTIIIAESPSNIVTFEVTATEVIITIDTPTGAVAAGVIEADCADGLTFSDSIIKNKITDVAAADGLAANDAPAKIAQVYRISVDGANLSDVVAKMATIISSLQDGVKLIDITAGGIIVEAALSDGALLSDVVSQDVSIEAVLSDGISLSDLTYAFQCTLNKLTNGDAEDDTYTDSSVHALVGWTNVGSHDANNKITIE